MNHYRQPKVILLFKLPVFSVLEGTDTIACYVKIIGNYHNTVIVEFFKLYNAVKQDLVESSCSKTIFFIHGYLECVTHTKT